MDTKRDFLDGYGVTGSVNDATYYLSKPIPCLVCGYLNTFYGDQRHDCIDVLKDKLSTLTHQKLKETIEEYKKHIAALEESAAASEERYNKLLQMTDRYTEQEKKAIGERDIKIEELIFENANLRKRAKDWENTARNEKESRDIVAARQNERIKNLVAELEKTKAEVDQLKKSKSWDEQYLNEQLEKFKSFVDKFLK